MKHRRRPRQLPLRLRPSSTGSRPSDCAPNHPLQMPQSAPSRSLGFASTATTRRSRPQKAAISPLHSPQLHRFDQCEYWKHRVSCRRVGFKHEAIFRKIRFRYNVRFEDGTGFTSNVRLRGDSISSSLSRFNEDRERSVVDEFDVHHRPESSCLDVQSARHFFDDRLSDIAWGGVRPTRPPPLADVSV